MADHLLGFGNRIELGVVVVQNAVDPLHVINDGRCFTNNGQLLQTALKPFDVIHGLRGFNVVVLVGDRNDITERCAAQSLVHDRVGDSHFAAFFEPLHHIVVHDRLGNTDDSDDYQYQPTRTVVSGLWIPKPASF